MLHQAFLRLKTGFSQFLLILEFLYTDYHFDPIGSELTTLTVIIVTDGSIFGGKGI